MGLPCHAGEEREDEESPQDRYPKGHGDRDREYDYAEVGSHYGQGPAKGEHGARSAYASDEGVCEQVKEHVSYDAANEVDE